MINESKIQELVKKHKDTGLTITAFCSNEGIAKSTFYYWRKRLSKEPVKSFIPLLVNSKQSTRSDLSKNYTHKQHEHHTSGDDFLLELQYPNGTRLRIKSDPDIEHLRTLVCLLDLGYVPSSQFTELLPLSSSGRYA